MPPNLNPQHTPGPAMSEIPITADYRAALLARRDELERLSRISADQRGPVELDQSRVGRLSRMDALQAQAMSKATETRRAQELKRIEAALSRLDEGEFGYCLTCGGDISPARLANDPTTPVCIDCAG